MSRCVDEGHCITCSDEGLAMRIVDRHESGLAICAADGGEETLVDVTLVGDAAAGDRVLVHAGVALTKLGEAAA